MSIFDFFKKQSGQGKQEPVTPASHNEFIDRLIGESRSKKKDYSLPAITSLECYQQLKDETEENLKLLLFTSIAPLIYFKKKTGRSYEYGSEEHDSSVIVTSLVSLLLRRKISLNDREIYELVHELVNGLDKSDYFSGIPFKPLLTRIEDNIRQNGLSYELSTALKLLIREGDQYLYAEAKSINENIQYLLQGAPEISPDDNDAFGSLVNTYLKSIEKTEDRKNWQELVKYLILSSGKTNPTDKWIKESKGLIDKTGKEQFVTKTLEWIQFCTEMLRQIHKAGAEYRHYLLDINHDLLKGLIWASGSINDPRLNNSLDEYGFLAFKKLAGVGAVSVRTGNACLYSFSILPFKEGISRLTKFRMKIKYPSILKQVDKYILQVAKKEGYSKERLEELAVPTYGIENGYIKTDFGDYLAVVEVKSIYEVNLYWEKENKRQSTVPAKIKETHKEELNGLKRTIKEIEGILPVQRDRIEQFYLLSRSWKYNEWMESYIHHPLMTLISSQLIWHFSEGTKKTQGIYREGQLRDVNNEVIDWPGENTEVQLWHPIGFAAEEVLKWRNYLEKAQIKQPFKQAHREVYLITDAELNTEMYSNRFAAHILRQHQFAALCKQRGWHYTLMGDWDSYNTPFIELPLWKMRAEFLVESDWHEDNMNHSNVFNYISTDQVRFFKDNEQIRIEDVPAMVFTEIMRDVDLFVGVTSIGNDPNWQNNPNQDMNTYWQGYSFGDLSESAKIREQVLKNLIPRLKIANVSSFDGKFLIVKGKIRTYKIHLGSGNILMAPNDQYLCIIPARSKSAEKVFLPFEGDNMLSIIISKALLLADDDKITDSTIISQIETK